MLELSEILKAGTLPFLPPHAWAWACFQVELDWLSTFLLVALGNLVLNCSSWLFPTPNYLLQDPLEST